MSVTIIEQYATAKLLLHPLQEKVYGREVVDSALVESIRRSGVITPLIIDSNQHIISGSRRWRAAFELKLSDVPVQRFEGPQLEAEALLIDANLQREKSAGQKAREAAELLRIEKVRAAEREKAGITLGPQVAKGRASEIVAKQTGQSRATVEKQAEIVSKAEAGSKAAKEVLEELDANKMSLAEAHRRMEEWEKWEEEDKAQELDEDDLDEDDEETSAEDFAASTHKWLDELIEEIRSNREWTAQKEVSEGERDERLSRLLSVASEIVSVGMKRLATKRHPDAVGGSHEEMQLVNEAAQWLRQHINVATPTREVAK